MNIHKWTCEIGIRRGRQFLFTCVQLIGHELRGECVYLESSLAYKVKAGRYHAVVEGCNELLECLGEGCRESIEPWSKQRLPTQHLWFHIHHTTSGHLGDTLELRFWKLSHFEWDQMCSQPTNSTIQYTFVCTCTWSWDVKLYIPWQVRPPQGPWVQRWD